MLQSTGTIRAVSAAIAASNGVLYENDPICFFGFRQYFFFDNSDAKKPRHGRGGEPAVRCAGIGGAHPGRAGQRFILYAPAEEHIPDERRSRAEQPDTRGQSSWREIPISLKFFIFLPPAAIPVSPVSGGGRYLHGLPGIPSDILWRREMHGLPESLKTAGAAA